MMSSRIVTDRDIDITREICPMTYVHTRLALDRLLPGQCLGVLLSGQEAIQNVPRTARAQGHAVLLEEPLPDGTMRVIIQRKPASI